MNYFSVFILFFISSIIANGQDVQVQSFVANDGIQLSSIIQKEISKNKKLNYFGFQNVFTEYKSIDSLDINLLNLAHYNFHKGIVLVGGLSVSKKT